MLLPAADLYPVPQCTTIVLSVGISLTRSISSGRGMLMAFSNTFPLATSPEFLMSMIVKRPDWNQMPLGQRYPWTPHLFHHRQMPL
jgi:hypothetical protein